MSRDYTNHGIAILNPYGDVWTPEVFDTPEEAKAFLAKHYANLKDCSGFKLAAAVQTTSVKIMPGEPILIDMPT